MYRSGLFIVHNILSIIFTALSMISKHRILLFLTLYIFSYLLIISCESSESGNSVDQQIIAEVGNGYEIDFPRLQRYHSDHEFGARFPDSETNGYEETLEILITNRLKHVDFFATGMHKDSTLRREIQRIVSEELFNEYFAENYLSEYINEESILAYYEGMKKELFYRQIVLPKSMGESDADRRETDDTIDDILQAASKGEDFDKLMDLYSRESSSASENGSRSVKWNPDQYNPLFNQLYELEEGEIKVLETSASILVIKIDKVEKQDIPSFNQIRGEIENSLRKTHMNRAAQEFEEEQKNRVNRDQIEWNRGNLEQLVAWMEKSGFFPDGYKNILQNALTEGNNFTILTYPYGSVDVAEFKRLLDEVLIMRSSSNISVESLQNFLVEALRRDHIVKKAENMGLDENILSVDRQSPTLRNQILRLYNREKIDANIPTPDEQNLQDFYEAHKDSLFYQLPRVRIFAHVYGDSSEAVDALERFKTGTRFEELEPSYLVRSFRKNREGRIEAYMRRGEPYLGEEAFSLSMNEVAGPISFDHAENGRQYALIKLTNTVPEKQLSYPEVEDRIASDFKDFHRQRIVQSVKEYLWDRYPVTIYEDNLRQRIPSI